MPRAVGTAAFTADGVKLPQRFRSGVWRFANGDRITHELGFIPLGAGHTGADARVALARGERPAWLAAVGTRNALGPGQSAW